MVRTNTRVDADSTLGSGSGSVTRANALAQEAPRARAASSTSRGMFWMAPTSTSTMNGRKMCVSPMRSPAKLNRSTTGPCTRPSAIIAWFTSPFWASRAIHPNVRTTRFSSSGNTTRMVSQPRHRERAREEEGHRVTDDQRQRGHREAEAQGAADDLEVVRIGHELRVVARGEPARDADEGNVGAE